MKIYRSRNGVVCGVCRGIAGYFDLSVFWIRTILVLLLLLTGLWPVAGIYLAAALIMKPGPVRPVHSEDEQGCFDTHGGSRRRALQSARSRYERLEGRIRRMEDEVTGREFGWKRKIRSSRS